MRRVAVCYGYIAEQDDAERRVRRGERQTYCPACDAWEWAGECEGRERDG